MILLKRFIKKLFFMKKNFNKFKLFFYIFFLFILVLFLIIQHSKIKILPKKKAESTPIFYFKPEVQNLNIGQISSINLYLDSKNQSINGFSIKFKTNKEILNIISINVIPPFERILTIKEENNSDIYYWLSAYLPPQTAVSPLIYGPFKVATINFQALKKSDGVEFSFVRDNNQEELIGNEGKISFSDQQAKICVESTNYSCGITSSCNSNQPKPIIKYPLNQKYYIDPRIEVSVFVPVIVNSCYPKEYQLKLFKNSQLICLTNWKTINNYGYIYVNQFDFKNTTGSACPELSDGNYEIEAQIRENNSYSETTKINFTKTDMSFQKIYPGDNFFSIYAGTDVVIPSGYLQLRRKNLGPPVFTDYYIKDGEMSRFFGDNVGVSTNYCFDQKYYRVGYNNLSDCIFYYYRKLREIAINSNSIGSIGIDDLKIVMGWIGFDNFSNLKKAAVGNNGFFGGTIYGDDACYDFYSGLDYVIFYIGSSNEDWVSRFQKVKGCAPKAQKIVYGYYPLAFRCLWGHQNLSDNDEIRRACQYAKDVKKRLDSREVAGVEIYDRTLSREGFDNCEEVDRKIATLSSEIFKTGNSSLCGN